MRLLAGLFLVCAACDGGSVVAKRTKLDFTIAGNAAGLTAAEDLLINNVAPGAPRLVKLDHKTFTFQDVGQGLPDNSVASPILVADDGSWWSSAGYSRAAGASTWEPIALPLNLAIRGFEPDGTPWGFDGTKVFRRASDKTTWVPILTPASPAGPVAVIKGGAIVPNPALTFVPSDGSTPAALFSCPTDRIEQSCQNAQVLFSNSRRSEVYVGNIGSPGTTGHLYRIAAGATYPVPFAQMKDVTPKGTGRWRHLRMGDDGRVYVHITNIDGTSVVLHLEPNGDAFIQDSDFPTSEGIFLATPSRAYQTSFQVVGNGPTADPVYVYEY